MNGLNDTAQNTVLFRGPGYKSFPLLVSTNLNGNAPEFPAEIEARLKHICKLSTQSGAYRQQLSVPFLHALAVIGTKGRLFRSEKGAEELAPLEGFEEYRDVLDNEAPWQACVEKIKENPPLERIYYSEWERRKKAAQAEAENV